MSGKTKLFYAIIFAILLLVSVKAGIALQEDFNAYAPQRALYACACSDVENVITLENTGDVTSVYGIEQSGTALPYSAINPATFSLKPGESKEVHNFISAPCGIEGEFDLVTSIDTTFGGLKELEQTVDIRKCVNVDVVQTTQPEEVCPCSPVRYDFIVENTGDFVDTFRLNVTPFAEYVSISEDLLVLGPGQSEEVYVFVATPCGMFGELDFGLVVETERSQVKAELPFNLKINPCYDYSLASAESYSVCQDLRNVVPVTITNSADVANTYFLSTGTEWSFFDPGVLSLGKKQMSDVNLTLYPASVPEGIYNVTLRSVSERGQLAVEKSIDVNVENCYSLMLYADPVPQLASCEEYTAWVHAENDGSRESTYSFSLFGERWASLSSTVSAVKAGDVKDIPVKLDVPCNVTGIYEFTLAANVTNFPEKMVQQKIGVDVVPIEEAYLVEINSIDEKIEADYDGGYVPITITNLGIRGGNYGLFLNTTESWIGIDRTSVDMPAGGSEEINIVLSPTNETAEGTYDVILTAIPDGKNIGYERSFSIKLREKTFLEKLADSWLFILSGLLFLVLLILLLVLVSRKKKKGEEEFWQEVEGEPSRLGIEERKGKLLEVEKKDKKWLKWLILILGILILLGAIGAGIYFLLSHPATPINETNETAIPAEEPEIEVAEMNETNVTGQGLLSRMWSWLFIEKNDTIKMVEEPEEPEPESLVENATIYVNRSGLRGYGDIIEVRGYENITIPLTIQNNYEPNTFKIRINESVDWIDVDRKDIEIDPNQKETVNIIVTPDERVEEGNYKIDIKIDIEGRTTPISEEIILKVTQEKPFYLKYLWYMLAGIAALIVLAVIAGIAEWKRKEEKEELESPEKEPKKKKESPKEAVPKEGGDYSWLKYMLLGVFIVLILAGLIYAGIYAAKSMDWLYEGNKTMNESISEEPTIGENLEERIEVGPEEIMEEPKIEYEKVFIKKAEETLIPLKISNINETATFRITINEDIGWISVDVSEVEIQPNESKTVNLIASPNETVEDGNYKVTVDVEVAGQETEFTQGFILQVRETPFSAVWTYLLYVLAGLVVLFVILAVLRYKENRGIDKPEEKGKKTAGKKEGKKGKKKTDIKLK